VITTAAGYPLDLTFYQAIKGVTAASHIVKPGGHILLMAACEEGVGAPEFRRMVLEAGSDGEFLRRIENAPATIDQWQLEKLALTTTRQRVSWYVPGVPPEYHGKLWGHSHPTAQSAIEDLAAGLAPGATVAVIPDGPYVLAKAEAYEMSSR
jgi:nickel-dependent lactate racemase